MLVRKYTEKNARAFTYYSQNCKTRNLIGTAVHLLESQTQGLCMNPGHQSKGHQVPLGLCAC